MITALCVLFRFSDGSSIMRALPERATESHLNLITKRIGAINHTVMGEYAAPRDATFTESNYEPDGHRIGSRSVTLLQISTRPLSSVGKSL